MKFLKETVNKKIHRFNTEPITLIYESDPINIWVANYVTPNQIAHQAQSSWFWAIVGCVALKIKT